MEKYLVLRCSIWEEEWGIYTEECENYKQKKNLGSFKKESDSRC